MSLVISFTVVLSSLSLVIMVLGYYSRGEILKTMPKVVIVTYLALYSAIWLASHDDVNLMADSVNTSVYRVFQSRESLMMEYFGVPGSPSEDDESGRFFYSVNGKVVAVPLSSFGLTDYSRVIPTARFVIEEYYLVGKHRYYLPVKIPKHKEYLETVDRNTGRLERFYLIEKR